MSYKMLFHFVGGLGLFIYGMKLMGDGLEKAAGNRMKKLIEVLTSNRIMAILVGCVVTMIIQSSSATTVMVVGFVNAGLMTLTQAAGVIMGANIGTTFVAQLIAFNLKDVAPLAIAIGAFILMFSKSKKVKDIAEIILGFGVLFVGMTIMSDSMKPIAKEKWFTDLVLNINNNPIMGVFVGMGTTAVVQSSGATIGILQSLGNLGALKLNVALPILFGDNIGTCATALLSSIGTNKNARRTALMHLTFNILGTIIFMLALKPVLFIVESFGGSPARQIANSHTIFNLANTIIQAPFIPVLVFIAMKLIPGKDAAEESKSLKYLDKRLLETPSVAVGQVINEVSRMGELASENLKASINALANGDEKALKAIYEKEETLNFLEREITAYMVSLSSTPLSEEQSDIVTSLFHVVNDFERVGDHAENLADATQYMIDNKLTFSDQAQGAIIELGNLVTSAVDSSIKALQNSSVEDANKTMAIEPEIDKLEKFLRTDHISRLNAGECSPVNGTIFLDSINNLERIGDHSNNIAQIVANYAKI